jgi:RNA polymerase sigma-70 factor (ECF subfamily)
MPERQPRARGSLTRSTVELNAPATPMPRPRRVLAGEVEAFAVLVERWQGPLFRLALRYTNERSSAEDPCQEVSCAPSGASASGAATQASTWLIAPATNVCRSRAPCAAARALGERDPAAPGAPAEPARRAPAPRGQKHRRYRDALHLYYSTRPTPAPRRDPSALPEGTQRAPARGQAPLENLPSGDRT